MIEIIGALMVGLYATATWPQIFKIWRTKSVEDLHIWTPASVSSACALALIYTYFTGGGLFLFVDYSLSLAGQLVLVVLIFKHRRTPRKEKIKKKSLTFSR